MSPRFTFHITEYNPAGYADATLDLCAIVTEISQGRSKIFHEKQLFCRTVPVMEVTIPGGQEYGGYLDRDFATLVASFQPL